MNAVTMREVPVGLRKRARRRLRWLDEWLVERQQHEDVTVAAVHALLRLRLLLWLADCDLGLVARGLRVTSWWAYDHEVSRSAVSQQMVHLTEKGLVERFPWRLTVAGRRAVLRMVRAAAVEAGAADDRGEGQ